MTPSETPTQKPRSVLTARKMVLLAGIAGIGATALFAGPGAGPLSSYLTVSPRAHAAESTAQRPVGFADVVEKVKPSVISVRVKMDGGSERMGLNDRDLPAPFDRFFRRFGSPDNTPNIPDSRPERRNFSIGQGSGFLISADGYAVTN